MNLFGPRLSVDFDFVFCLVFVNYHIFLWYEQVSTFFVVELLDELIVGHLEVLGAFYGILAGLEVIAFITLHALRYLFILILPHVGLAVILRWLRVLIVGLLDIVIWWLAQTLGVDSRTGRRLIVDRRQYTAVGRILEVLPALLNHPLLALEELVVAACCCGDIVWSRLLQTRHFWNIFLVSFLSIFLGIASEVLGAGGAMVAFGVVLGLSVLTHATREGFPGSHRAFVGSAGISEVSLLHHLAFRPLVLEIQIVGFPQLVVVPIMLVHVAEIVVFKVVIIIARPLRILLKLLLATSEAPTRLL